MAQIISCCRGAAGIGTQDPPRRETIICRRPTAPSLITHFQYYFLLIAALLFCRSFTSIYSFSFSKCSRKSQNLLLLIRQGIQSLFFLSTSRAEQISTSFFGVTKKKRMRSMLGEVVRIVKTKMNPNVTFCKWISIGK